MSERAGHGLSRWLLVRRSLRYYWRANVPVALGVAVAAAVLVGSLAVGDSVRGTLKDVALERLGRVQFAMQPPGWVRDGLADELAAGGRLSAAALLAAEGTAADPAGGAVVPTVTVLGVRDDFWPMAAGGRPGGPPGGSEAPAWSRHETPPASRPEGREVLINAQLAEDLGVAAGDALLLTVGRRGDARTDTIFGRRDPGHTVQRMRVVVRDVLPAHGAGAFSLRRGHDRVRNVYVELAWLQRQLDRPGRVNAVLVAGAGGASPDAEAELSGAFTLEDYGLRVRADSAGGCLSLEGDALVLPAAAVRAALRCDAANVCSVYLANAIARADRPSAPPAPYCVVAALDLPGERPLGPDETLLNSWTADDLGVRAGDRVRMTFYVADERGGRPAGPLGIRRTANAWSPAGDPLNETSREFRVRGVVPMEGPAADPAIVPPFEGITNAESMQAWDPPFPIELERIRPVDEDYWRRYRTAPKAFLSRQVLRELWLSGRPAGTAAEDEGWVTSVRADLSAGGDPEASAAGLRKCLLKELRPADFGLTFRPVRAEAVAAATGSTDFGVLFVSMSMFLVAAAAVLVGLLMRLTVERRAAQYGIMQAVGIEARTAAGVLAREGLLVAVAGVALGAALGVGYAWAVIRALHTWWRGALGEGGLDLALHVRAESVAYGALAGFLAAGLAVWWGARSLRRAPALTLLAGWRALAGFPDGTLFAVRRTVRRMPSGPMLLCDTALPTLLCRHCSADTALPKLRSAEQRATQCGAESYAVRSREQLAAQHERAAGARECLGSRPWRLRPF